jgi:hypothetical protein
VSDEVCKKLRYLKSEIERWREDDKHRTAMAVSRLEGANNSLEEMLDLMAELAEHVSECPDKKEVGERLNKIAILIQDSFDDLCKAYYFHRSAADWWSLRLKLLLSSISEMLEKLGCKES